MVFDTNPSEVSESEGEESGETEQQRDEIHSRRIDGPDSFLNEPTELTEGVYLLEECTINPHLRELKAAQNPQWFKRGHEFHTPINTYLLVGEDEALLFDTSSPNVRNAITDGVREILEKEDVELSYLVLSHDEAAHVGNAYPISREAAMVHPDYQEDADDTYELQEELHSTLIARKPSRVAPEFHYFDDAELVEPGHTIDLGGGRVVEFIEPVWQDGAPTLWMYDHKDKGLYCVDSYGFPHCSGDCGKWADELEHRVSQDQMMEYNGRAFRYIPNCNPWKIIDQHNHLYDNYDIEHIFPAHGQPIREEIDRYRGLMDSMVERISRDGSLGTEYVSAEELTDISF
ncbi:hypothetical protein GJ631_02895 [Natronomonas sp. CBA1123]|jgi:flavorubredoxin|uniref:MBL fold metallo-hydrolase n=1 Tax=Natronomonas sp. CBA1123 TaxID=2668070 RepID=UPI0012EAAB59|nr:MBL fold metallo-hydrolase [Natronomonas sp. CBA1123]MUV85553.1 hypothetical protein [Natronomonas sp. CBA1123]